MPRPDSAPNVLLIIADDHRADSIAALGNPAVQTPVLDKLVQQGTTFTRAGIMGGLMPAVCAPSRACLLTGRNVFRADASPDLNYGPHFEVRLPATACTLPERFRAAGYETFVTGKWHNDVAALLRSFEGGRNIFKGGMCEHTSVPVRDLADFHTGASARIARGFSTEIFCRTAAEFLRQRTRDRPFFACVALTSPHDPRTPPPEFRARYDPATIPLPENFLPDHPFDNGDLQVRDEKLAAKPLSAAVMREHLADYFGMISHHDAWIGRVLDALDETGASGDTLVVYLSDHGLALGSHGLLGKQNLYEHSVRVPFLLRGPGIPAGRCSDALVYSLDLYATLCALSGIAPPPGLDSKNLQPLFTNGNARVRDDVCALYLDRQRMISDGTWKLIVYHVVGGERVQLFNLAKDPHERNDLSGTVEHASQLSRLAERLGRWQQEVGDRWWTVGTRA